MKDGSTVRIGLAGRALFATADDHFIYIELVALAARRGARTLEHEHQASDTRRRDLVLFRSSIVVRLAVAGHGSRGPALVCVCPLLRLDAKGDGPLPSLGSHSGRMS